MEKLMTETMTDQETPQNLLDFLVANNASTEELMRYRHYWDDLMMTQSEIDEFLQKDTEDVAMLRKALSNGARVIFCHWNKNRHGKPLYPLAEGATLSLIHI